MVFEAYTLTHTNDLNFINTLHKKYILSITITGNEWCIKLTSCSAAVSAIKFLSAAVPISLVCYIADATENYYVISTSQKIKASATEKNLRQ